MGSPRILRDIITATGHRFESLGTGFIDHPLGFVGKVRFKKDAVDAINRLSMIDHDDYVVRSALRLKSACGRYTCCAFLRPALTIHNSLSIYKYKSLLGRNDGLDQAPQRVFLEALSPRHHRGGVLPRIWREYPEPDIQRPFRRRTTTRKQSCLL